MRVGQTKQQKEREKLRAMLLLDPFKCGGCPCGACRSPRPGALGPSKGSAELDAATAAKNATHRPSMACGRDEVQKHDESFWSAEGKLNVSAADMGGVTSYVSS